ncbi:MAG: O-antigen ligase family protein [Gammaproteobacteria bacterium]|nr:O-antigen ligase family protein [Gammaproteobacteria bacterium]
MFPVLSLSVRHWLSGIYSLLALLALFVVFRKSHDLFKEEKILFALFILLLLSFTISASLNGWSDNSIRRLSNVLKYILFFPTYLLIRQYKDLSGLLFMGIVTGGAALGLQAIFDVFYLGLPQGSGIYGTIIFGDLSILFFSTTLILLFFKKEFSVTTWLYIISAMLSALAVYLSGSRNAWIASVFCVLVIPLLCFKFMKYKRAILVIVPIVTISASTFFFTETVHKRLNLAVSEFTTFVAQGAPKDIPIKYNSVGFRLEQWRVALHITHDAFFFGYGGGNAGKHVKRYAEKGLAHPDLIVLDTERGIGGLHSTYFETLINEGVIGLAVMFVFVFYPIYTFLKARESSPLLSTVGIIFVTNYMIFGISENPFVHDNFTSVYLILLSVFFSETIRNKYLDKGHRMAAYGQDGFSCENTYSTK